LFVISKKLDFSDDEDQLNEKLNKQSLNGDIRSRSDNTKGYLSNTICDPSLAQNLKVKKLLVKGQLLLNLHIFSFFIFLGE